MSRPGAGWWAVAARLMGARRRIFGNYLMRNLGPLERERVGWSMILAVRAWDLALGGWVWSRIDGLAKRDGALFGALVALFSRLSLYSFEHSYFLLRCALAACPPVLSLTNPAPTQQRNNLDSAPNGPRLALERVRSPAHTPRAPADRTPQRDGLAAHLARPGAADQHCPRRRPRHVRRHVLHLRPRARWRDGVDQGPRV